MRSVAGQLALSSGAGGPLGGGGVAPGPRSGPGPVRHAPPKSRGRFRRAEDRERDLPARGYLGGANPAPPTLAQFKPYL